MHTYLSGHCISIPRPGAKQRHYSTTMSFNDSQCENDMWRFFFQCIHQLLSNQIAPHSINILRTAWRDATKLMSTSMNKSKCSVRAGFKDVLVPCCTGKNDLYELNCGATDSKGHKLYKLCKDVSKAILFDGIHPTQATWKFIIKHLYASTPGFTNEESELSRWIKKYAS
jgi:hypothetical protein